MSFNFGIIFAVICIIGGLLMIILYKPYWWLMKKQEMPDHYKWADTSFRSSPTFCMTSKLYLSLYPSVICL